MSTKPQITVIMSVKNNEKTIHKCIKSILNQSFSDFYFYIIDDCSSDNTRDILFEFQKLDKRVKIFLNDKHLGLTASLNKLINLVETDLIARQDGDDYSLSDRFEKQVALMNSNNLDGCTTRAYVLNSKKKRPRFTFLLPNKIIIKYKNPFIHGSLLIKRSVINNIGNYDKNFYYSQDYKLFSDLLKNNYKIKIIRKAFYVLNTEDNISSLNKKEQDFYANCVRKNIFPTI